jgi:hypothetical protein
MFSIGHQLVAHLLGDYVFQTDWMANKKTTSKFPALIHAASYTLSFAFVSLLFGLSISLPAYAIIGVSHYFIDHYRLARYVMFAKNWITDTSLKWSECDKTGYPNSAPPWLTVWLLIAGDNTLHILINALAIHYFPG